MLRPNGRRASGAANNLPPAGLTGPGRNIHRANDSQHLNAAPVGGASMSNLFNAPAAGPYQAVMQLLLNRIKNRLPCYSGMSIVEIEADDTVQQVVESLRDLSKDFPDFVAWTLASMLDHLSKQTDNLGYLRIDVLQSQLFVLKVLCVAMGSRWPSTDESRPNTRTGHGDGVGSGPSTPLDASPMNGRYPRPRPSRETMSGATLASAELPPLDEHCAKYILSVMVLFVRQKASDEADQEATLTHHDFEVENVPRVPVMPDSGAALQPSQTYPYSFQGVRSRASHASFGSASGYTATGIPVPKEARVYTNTPASMAETSSSLNLLIGKYAGVVIYHLSASNWPVVFARVRAKIYALERIEKGHMPDVVDLQLMTECALDRTRLIQLLQEVSSLFLTMKRDAQVMLAVPLAAAIWHWIDLYPAEFAEAISGPRRLEGAPERVFDLIFQNMQPESRHLLWPTLTVLMCVSFERLNQDFGLEGGGGRKSHKKEILLVEQLIKAAFSTVPRQAMSALRCLIDIGKAASRATFKRDVPLRTLALDITHSIQNAVMKHPNGRPFWDSPDDIDVAIYADALVMLWRFLPEVESIELFRSCLLSERSDAIKLCAVTAMHTLARDAQQAPDHLSPFVLWHEFSLRLRVIFTHASMKRGEADNSTARRPTPRPKSKGSATSRLSDRELLLIAILALWRADIAVYFLGLGDLNSPTDMAPIGINVWDNVSEPVLKLFLSKAYTFFVDTAFIMRPGDLFLEYVTALLPKLTPQYIFAACTQLYHSRTDFEGQEMWIQSLDTLLQTYTRPCPYEHIEAVKQAPERIPAFTIAEIILLISLTSVNSKVCAAAAQALRKLAQAERNTGAIRHTAHGEDESVRRLQAYEQLGDPRCILMGRVAYQKHVRRLLSRLTILGPIYMAVWQECYFRWIQISKIYPSLSTAREDVRAAILTRPLSQDDARDQWRNLSLFMAATAGICIPDVPYEEDALAQYVPLEFMPDTARILLDSEQMLDNFLGTMVMLLLAPDPIVRDVAREVLGAELKPRMYATLYKKVEEVIVNLTRSSEVNWENQYTIFVDQFVTLYRALLDNPGVVNADEKLQSAFGNSLLLLAGFIVRFDHDFTPVRLRIKFCSLVELAAKRCDPSGVLRRETFERHELLEMVVDWVRDPPADPEAARLQQELNVACLRALVNILEKCPVPPENGSRGEERVNYVTRFGFRLSDLLLRIVEMGQGDDESASTRTNQSQRTRSAQLDAEVRDLCVNGMVYIMSANMERVVKHAYSRAFADDVETRLVFMAVCARALKKGPKIEVSRPLELNAPKHRLADLVQHSNLTLALAICETCPGSDIDNIIPVLFNIFDTRTSLMSLLKIMIDREVNSTDTETELFRGNSMCTRMLSYFGKIHGYYYLRQLIKHLVEAMSTAPSECQYELDPARVGKEMAAENTETIKRVATAFLEMIQGSVPALPSMFREICAHIANKVQETYPEAKFAALGAFIFLRFISPAVVSPETVDVSVPRDEGGNMRRGLMIIAKIIQNLANNIFFGKEAYMVVLNEYLREHIVTVTRYLSELNKYIPPGREDVEEEWLGTSFDESDVLVLHRFFDSHIDKIGKEILSVDKAQDVNGTASAGATLWNDLCEALVELTQPGDVPKAPTVASNEHEPYLDLMERFANRSLEPVRDVFVEVPTEIERAALFVFAMHAVDIETLDIDLLMYHMFKMICSPDNIKRDFDIIFDFTSFAGTSEIPVQWMKYCLEMIPTDLRHRFTNAYLLNPNQVAQKYLRRLYNVSAAAAPTPNVTQHMTAAELQRHVSTDLRIYLSTAFKFEEEPGTGFTEVGMRQGSQLRLLANIHIGATHLKITSLKAQTVSPHLSCKTVDIVDLADVSDVYNVQVGAESHEFIIRQRQGMTIYFNSVERDAIVKAVRDARGKLRGIRLAGDQRAAKQQSNLHASLLTIAMLNVGHSNTELRVISMELLEAICIDLKVEDAMEVATQVTVPYSPSVFVVRLSEQLAHLLPYLTLDFVTEVCTTLGKQSVATRLQSIQYMSPWIANLQHFSNPASPLHEPSGAKLRDAIRLLVDFTTNDPDVAIMLQKYVWEEVAKADQTFVYVILEELTRAAGDAGVGTRRCQIIGETVGTLASIGVRGRILSKVRKVFGKTNTQATQNLSENSHWGEISALTYLTLASCVHFKHASHVQIFMPEMAHLITHVAACGEVEVRRAVHAIVLNIIQSMQHFVTDDALLDQWRDLQRECWSTEVLQSFGLQRSHAISLIAWDPSGSAVSNDVISLDLRELLTRFLLKVMKAASGSQGVMNVWRARWMSLVTATSFQHSPCIQSRTFAVIGVLATGDVDDDLLYQMLVAFKQGLSQSDETRTLAVVTMLRCVTQVVPVLPPDSRYLAQLFWLGFALVQASAIAFYVEATRLMQQCLETMDRHGAFVHQPVSTVLLEARKSLHDIAEQLDMVLKLEFRANFAFALVAPIFKGLHVKTLQGSADSLLRCLLKVTASAESADPAAAEVGAEPPVHPNVLAYFLALLSTCSTQERYRQLLLDARVAPAWAAEAGTRTVPHVPLDLLGPLEQDDVLLVTTFLSVMLSSAQGDDEESEIVYTLLAEIAEYHPDQIVLAYGCLQDRIKDTIQNSMNPAILSAAAQIFRTAVQEGYRSALSRPSAATLNTIDEGGPIDTEGQHQRRLEKLGMRGLSKTFTFLRPGDGNATTLIRWIPDLVHQIIGQNQD